jgi:hypothetical protein
METWKPVPDFEDFYEVSDHGRVRSLQRKTWVYRPDLEKGHWKSVRPRVLRPVKGNGYPAVGLYRHGCDEKHTVHTLVCRAFYGPRPPNADVLHLDNDKTNNHLSNLRWGTRSENIQQCWDEGRREQAGFCKR